MRFFLEPRPGPAILRGSTPPPTVSRPPDISMKYLPRLAAAAMAVAAVSPVHAAMDYFVTTQTEYDALNSTTFNPGDNIFLRGNTTFNGGLYFDPADSGNDASGNLIDPITLTSFGDGRATINAGNDTGLFAFNNGGFNIANLNFRGSGVALNGTTTSTGSGINFFTDQPGNIKQNHVYIDNVDVSGFGGRGISLGGFNQNTGYNDVRITNSALHDNRSSGLLTYAQNRAVNTNVLVDNVRAFNNVGDPNSTGNTGSGIVLGNTNGGVVQNSVAYNNGRNNKPTEGPVGIWTYDSNDITLQFNESYDNTTSNGDGGGFDLDQNVTNSLVQYNYSHDNAGAGYLLFDGDGTANGTNSGNVVRYNISENDGRRGNSPAAGITIGGNVRDLEVYGNTVFITNSTAVAGNTTVEPAIKIDTFGATSPRGILIANNIFYTDDGGRLILKGNGVTNDTSAANGIRFLNNDYFAADGSFQIRWNNVTYTSLDAWLTAITGQERFDKNGDGTAEIVALNVDPLLTDPGNGGTVDPDAPSSLTAYLLQEDSPLIDAGLDLSRLGVTVGPRDFDGTTLPQGDALDIGADEFIPEPGTAALLAVAGATLLARRRRRTAPSLA